MRFGYTVIYVSDVDTTLSFYEKAFKLKKLYLHESMQYGELATGSTKLAFASESLAESNGVDFISNRSNASKAPGFEIALIADDVAEAYQHAIAAGAIDVKGPIEKPWGQTVAYVRDLNGVLVEICSSL
ncbi:MAG: VOC family protein [Legionellales bacterium]|jgi:catechol 2,3-dioxygenase-like lactoylglutathione lyase family enzyme